MKRGFVILADGFNASEAVVLAAMMRNAGIALDLIGLNTTMPESEEGTILKADARFNSGISGSYEFMIIPGGRAYGKLSNTSSVLAEIQQMNAKQKLLAAISTGPVVLARSGVLDSREAVCKSGYEKELPKPRPGRVKVDGNIITASSTGDVFEMGLAIIRWLAPRKEQKIKRDMSIRL